MRYNLLYDIASICVFLEKVLNKCFYNGKLKKTRYYIFTGIDRNIAPFSFYSRSQNSIFIRFDEMDDLITYFNDDFIHEFSHKIEFEFYKDTNHKHRFYKIQEKVKEQVLNIFEQTYLKEYFKDISKEIEKENIKNVN